MLKQLKRVPIAAWIFLVALTYYAALSAKSYTWVFISGDSGDWLAASNWWMVPQPYGSPLYILLGQLLNAFPGDLVVKMTIGLSVIPSAVTVMLVYLIVQRLTHNKAIAVASVLVLLGSAIFLSQSTVLEEYALATMLLTLGFWTYINDHRYWTALCWGLGVSIHVFVLGAVLFWLIIEWRNYLKPFVLVTLPIVTVLYGFILLLMYLDTPRLLAGGLNLYSLQQYLFVTAGAILGQLSVFEAPKRLLFTAQLVMMSFGLALIPLTKSVRKPIPKSTAVMLGVILWTLWFQITNLDSSAWTFITYASPFVAILVGLGLSRLSTAHLKYVVAGALVLVVVNGAALNANILTSARPLATSYYDALQELPDKSIVLCNPGTYSLGLFYVMSEGKDLVPLVYPYLDNWEFRDYSDWLGRNYLQNIQVGLISGWDTLTVIEYALNVDRDVYYADSPWRHSDIRQSLVLEDTEWTQITKVTGLTGLEPEPVIK